MKKTSTLDLQPSRPTEGRREGWVWWLGQIPYREAWALQEHLHQTRLEGGIPDTLLLLEHPPVLTLGRAWKPQHLLLSEEEYRRRGIEICQTDRGGDVTYHAPGQLVGYPIFDLRLHGQDLHRYLRDVEQALLIALEAFGIRAHRREGYTGVWVGDEKVAAIGIKVARWVSLHGFALNVNADLTPFSWFIPCGIQDKGVTSLQKILGKSVPMAKARAAVIHGFEQVFDLNLNKIPASIARQTLNKLPPRPLSLRDETNL